MFLQCLTALLGLMVASLVALATRAAPDPGRVSGTSLASARLDPAARAGASAPVDDRAALRTVPGDQAALAQAEEACGPAGDQAGDEAGPLTFDAGAGCAGAGCASGRDVLPRRALKAASKAVARRAFWAPTGARAPPRA